MCRLSLQKTKSVGLYIVLMCYFVFVLLTIKPKAKKAKTEKLGINATSKSTNGSKTACFFSSAKVIRV